MTEIILWHSQESRETWQIEKVRTRYNRNLREPQPPCLQTSLSRIRERSFRSINKFMTQISLISSNQKIQLNSLITKPIKRWSIREFPMFLRVKMQCLSAVSLQTRKSIWTRSTSLLLHLWMTMLWVAIRVCKRKLTSRQATTPTNWKPFTTT